MRVPSNIMSRTLVDQINSVNDRLTRLQTEVASGLRIQRPSDDPEGALRSAYLDSGLAHISHYASTVSDCAQWLKSEDTALGKLNDLLRSVRDTALQGGNPLPEDARETLGSQIDTMLGALMQSANSTDGTRYLFAGFKTNTVPFSMDASLAVTYGGDNGAKQIAISDGITFTLNHDGAKVFNMGGAADASIPDLFATVNALAANVRAGDSAALQGNIAALDAHMSRVISLRGETGTRLQQVNLAQDRLETNRLLLTDLLADTRSADLAKSLVELKETENLYQAASYVASTLAQGGLLQWLR